MVTFGYEKIQGIKTAIIVTTLAFLITIPITLEAGINANVPQQERDALAELYNATDGDNWDVNDGWNETASLLRLYKAMK